MGQHHRCFIAKPTTEKMQTTLIYLMDNLMSMDKYILNKRIHTNHSGVRHSDLNPFGQTYSKQHMTRTQSNSCKTDLDCHLWTSVPAGEDRKKIMIIKLTDVEQQDPKSSFASCWARSLVQGSG